MTLLTRVWLAAVKTLDRRIGLFFDLTKDSEMRIAIGDKYLILSNKNISLILLVIIFRYF